MTPALAHSLHPEKKPCEDTVRRWWSASQEGEPHWKPALAIRSCLNLWPPEPWEIDSYCLSHPVYGILLWQPKETMWYWIKHPGTVYLARKGRRKVRVVTNPRILPFPTPPIPFELEEKIGLPEVATNLPTVCNPSVYLEGATCCLQHICFWVKRFIIQVKMCGLWQAFTHSDFFSLQRDKVNEWNQTCVATRLGGDFGDLESQSVCVCERERERQRDGVEETLHIHLWLNSASWQSICDVWMHDQGLIWPLDNFFQCVSRIYCREMQVSIAAANACRGQWRRAPQTWTTKWRGGKGDV